MAVAASDSQHVDTPLFGPSVEDRLGPGRYLAGQIRGARTAGRKLSAGQAEALAEKLSTGTWVHDYPISPEEAKALGLNVSTDIPNEVLELLALYPSLCARKWVASNTYPSRNRSNRRHDVRTLCGADQRRLSQHHAAQRCRGKTPVPSSSGGNLVPYWSEPPKLQLIYNSSPRQDAAARWRGPPTLAAR